MKPKKTCLICVAVSLIICGLLAILLAPTLLRYIIRTQFVLTPDARMAQSWKHVPSMMPMDVYLFNWTNPQDIYNKSVKPKFEQVGPYRFMMDLKKTNITWNENGTVTYKMQKFWHFSQEGTNGSLQDKITMLNTPALGAAHVTRNWLSIARLPLSLYMDNISVTHTVDEFLFTGYPDEITKMASKWTFLDKNAPKWERFGYFYMRNGSTDFEGIMNIETGLNSVFGQVRSWNYMTQTPYYEGDCGKVEGSSGDKFNASQDTIKLFFSDLCRFLELQYVGDTEVDGILGRKYVVGDRTLDNGTKYSSNKCFCTGDCAPSGVFDLSGCRYGSPTFMSLPHFHNADPYFVNLVEGLRPQQDKHEFSMVLEPKTGVPLLANAKLQVNFLLHSMPYKLYEDVPTVYFPTIWFDQRATIPKANLAGFKLLLNATTIMTSIGGVMMVAAIILLVVLNLDFIKKKKKKPSKRNQLEAVPLKSHGQCGLLSKKQLNS